MQFEPQLTFIIGVFFLCFVLLNIISIPGNWFIAGSMVGYKFFAPRGNELDTKFFVLLGIILVLSEVVSMVLHQSGKDKKAPDMADKMYCLVGALIGTLVCAPLGLGSVVGTLLGAYLAVILHNMTKGRTVKRSYQEANNSMSGKLAAFVVRIAFGFALLLYCVVSIWPKGLL